jgi:molybdenum cofactor cytidylyltransferase
MGCEAPSLPGILLAAGRSSRFPLGNKLLVVVEGEAVVRRSLRAMLSPGNVEPVILVVGYEHERILEALSGLRDHPKLQVVLNECWAEGLSTSLRAGLARLPKEASGVVVLPADMPFMTSKLVERVAQRFLNTGMEEPCYPVLKGEKGHPTAVPRRLFAEIEALRGDMGASSLIKAQSGIELELAPEEARTQLDLDSLEDYAPPEGEGR